MTSRVFVIADLHFGHKKLQDIRGISDDELVARWNSVVTKRDVVYVLGDVFKLDRVPELNGFKKLAMGNHDLRPVTEYAKHFSKVSAGFEFDGAWLSHIPIHPNQKHRYRMNVHGHSHDKVVTQTIVFPNPVDPFGEVVQEHYPDPWYRCVSVEQVNYTPILLQPITSPVPVEEDE